MERREENTSGSSKQWWKKIEENAENDERWKEGEEARERNYIEEGISHHRKSQKETEEIRKLRCIGQSERTRRKTRQGEVGNEAARRNVEDRETALPEKARRGATEDDVERAKRRESNEISGE